MLKAIVFTALFASFLALTTASVDKDEYFFGEAPDTLPQVNSFDERDTNTTGIAVTVSNTTVSYNASSTTKLKINFPFSIPGAVATLNEANSDNPDFQDPTEGTTPGSFVGASFFLDIYDSDLNEIHEMPAPFEISISNDAFDANTDLFLFNTTTRKWTSASTTCPTNLQKRTFANGTLTVAVCHLTQFAPFSVTPNPSTNGGDQVVAPSSGKSNTTLIIAIVVPVGTVILIAIIVLIVIVVRRNKHKRSLYDVEMAHHKTKTTIASGPATPQSRVTDFTRGSLKAEEESSSDEDSEDSESEIVAKARAEESEETTSESYEEDETEESDSDDSASTWVDTLN